MFHKRLKIEVKYRNGIKEIVPIHNGDWIDLRAVSDISLKKGEFKYIPLGVSIALPRGYEAIVAPRSSTPKKHKIIMANSIGIIDNSYCGDDDQWMFPALALEDTTIHKDDRICQFRIIKNQPKLEFITVEHLHGTNRGGFGSTGVN